MHSVDALENLNVQVKQVPTLLVNRLFIGQVLRGMLYYGSEEKICSKPGGSMLTIHQPLGLFCVLEFYLRDKQEGKRCRLVKSSSSMMGITSSTDCTVHLNLGLWSAEYLVS